MTLETRVCLKCTVRKPVEQFKKDSKGYRRNTCMSCRRLEERLSSAQRRLESGRPRALLYAPYETEPSPFDGRCVAIKAFSRFLSQPRPAP